MIETLQLEKLKRRTQDDARSFREAKPFRHIVLNDLLVDGLAEPFVAAFPEMSWDGWYRFDGKFQFRNWPSAPGPTSCRSRSIA